MMGGRIFKTMFAMLVILVVVFPLSNVYGFTTAVKRKSYNTAFNCWVEIKKPKTDGLFYRVYLCDNKGIPLPGLQSIFYLWSKLFHEPKMEAIILNKITVEVSASRNIAKVEFYYWYETPDLKLAEDTERPFKYEFKPSNTGPHNIKVVGYTKDGGTARDQVYFYAII